MKKLLVFMLALALLALSVPALAEADAVDNFNNGYAAWQDGDYEAAVDYWTKAADAGLVEAQYNLGIIYSNGNGVEQSWEKAAEYLGQAADQGYAEAQDSLARLYRDGKGVEQSWEQAAELFKLAADQGNADAQCSLGRLYRDGKGVGQSWEKAAEYFGMAADQGNASAQFNMGILLEKGEGVEQSWEQAAEYYRLAADQGNANAQYNLGVLYRNGEGVEQSWERAAEYFRLAADQGDALAQFNLGYQHAKGNGVEQSWEQAVDYYKQAADQGLAEAQYNLGMMYFWGEGVGQSWEQAVAYFRMAADQSYEGADDMLKQAERNLNAAGATGPEAMREQAVAMGMNVPVPGDGEALYVGVGEVPDTRQTKLYLAFIASPNGRAIRRLTMLGYALEVPVEGSDPEMIIRQVSTRDDDWIDLQPDTTDIVLQENPPISVTDLKLGNGGATCRMTMADSYQDPEKGVDGMYNASAEIELVNVTGDIFVAAIDPPTRAEAEAAGMKLPEPGEGEALYLGAANVSQAETLYLAFCLSADGASLNRLTMYIGNMEAEFQTDSARVHISASSSSVTNNNSLPVGPQIEAGSIRLSDFELDGDRASAVLHYTHHFTQENYDLPFDVAHVTFARVD